MLGEPLQHKHQTIGGCDLGNEEQNAHPIADGIRQADDPPLLLDPQRRQGGGRQHGAGPFPQTQARRQQGKRQQRDGGIHHLALRGGQLGLHRHDPLGQPVP